MSSSYEQILYDVKDRILTITLNRPEKLNAYTPIMQRELIDALQRADADDEVRVIIFTGAGRGYCAGADLSSGGSTFDYDKRDPKLRNQQSRDGGGMLSLAIFEVRKPVIGAINGPAVGVGATMTLPMDVRMIADTAKMGFVFARRGIAPEACSTYFLPRIVGISQAAEWVYTGRVFSAQEAHEKRLVSRILPPDQLLPAARELAREIADNTSAISVALSRQMLWRMLGVDHPMEAHKIESRAINALGKAPDAFEGVSSFLEKRAPQFKQRPSTDMPAFFPWWEERPFS